MCTFLWMHWRKGDVWPNILSFVYSFVVCVCRLVVDQANVITISCTSKPHSGFGLIYVTSYVYMLGVFNRVVISEAYQDFANPSCSEFLQESWYQHRRCNHGELSESAGWIAAAARHVDYAIVQPSCCTWIQCHCNVSSFNVSVSTTCSKSSSSSRRSHKFDMADYNFGDLKLLPWFWRGLSCHTVRALWNACQSLARLSALCLQLLCHGAALFNRAIIAAR